MTTRRDFVRTTAAAAGAFTIGCAEGPDRTGDGTPGSGDDGSGPDATGAGGVGRAATSLDILILGGTGFIGPHEVDYARARGHTLTLFNRGQTAPAMFPNVEQLRGDRGNDLTALEGREWDVVIDNSGFYPRHARMSAELLADRVDRYMFVSSISAYDSSLPPGAHEYDAPIATMEDPTDESEGPYGPSYGPRKALCEAEVLEAFGEDRTVIVRPGLITGPGDPTDRVRHWIARMRFHDEVLVPGEADDPVQWIDARDMTGWMVRMLEQGDVGIYNAVGPANPTGMERMVTGIREASESEAELVWVRDEFAVEMQIAGLYSPWIPADGPRGFMQVSHARALSTGLEHRSLESTIRDMVAEFDDVMASGDDPEFGTRGGAPLEREAELIAEWRSRNA